MPTQKGSRARSGNHRRVSRDHRERRETGLADEYPSPRRKRAHVDSGTEDEYAGQRVDARREQVRNGDRERDRPRNRDGDKDRRRSQGIVVEKKRTSTMRGGAAGDRRGDRRKERGHAGSQSTSQLLSEDSLRMLNGFNEKGKSAALRVRDDVVDKREIHREMKNERKRKKKKRRIVSGPMLEEARMTREKGRRRRFGRKFWIIAAIFVIILIIIIVAAVVAAGKKKQGGSSSSKGATSAGSPTDPPPRNELKGLSQDSIPTSAKGTILDPFTWYDTAGFNVTYTDVKVGGLPIMGLFDKWDDGKQANGNVPPLNSAWSYPKMPIRGVNIGGWLSLEPFITPSLFNKYSQSLNIVDEYTLTQYLGANAAKTLETHYATFATESTFAEIAAAGLDHVRIPYSYWAVTTYPGDPYVSQISWRYLLRGIEWARKYGLRVKLDIHGLPGSQNGWNHSGRWGAIGWLNGTDGDTNAQRSLDIHTQLATFFAQPRYKNIITLYGLANEPAMVKLQVDKVLKWTTDAKAAVRKAGLNATLVIGDGFLGLEKWAGLLPDSSGMLLDVHQYVIFNVQQVVWNHTTKINYACQGWTEQTVKSMDPRTGFGAILCGEWSQADTDCADYLNNVHVGSKWEGTFVQGEYGQPPITSPLCPASTTGSGSQCSCASANADPSRYSAVYKQWLKMFAEAQMNSFEKGWGWFYWTWDTETAVQWSYKKGLAAGILPSKAYAPAFKCDSAVPDYAALGLSDNY